MTTREMLLKTAALLEPPGAWTQKAFARDARGRPVEPDGPLAVCWCIEGAFFHVNSSLTQREAARKLLFKVTPQQFSLEYNDAPCRTQAEVVQALRTAADLAGAA